LSDTLDALQDKDSQIEAIATSQVSLASEVTHLSEALKDVEGKLRIALEEIEPCKKGLIRVNQQLLEEKVTTQLLTARVAEMITQHTSLEIENKELLLAQQSATFAQKDIHEKVGCNNNNICTS
jgi:hypothetical protein